MTEKYTVRQTGVFTFTACSNMIKLNFRSSCRRHVDQTTKRKQDAPHITTGNPVLVTRTKTTLTLEDRLFTIL